MMEPQPQIEVLLFTLREDRDAAVRLSEDLDEWNGVPSVSVEGYARKPSCRPDGSGRHGTP